MVLIFDISDVYETAAYDWLFSQYQGREQIVEMALKFLGNIDNWRLFFVC